MDPSLSAQDVIRCDLCETAIVQMYCDFCHVNLCKPCIGEHIADEYDKHKIVPFQQRKSTLIYPKCAVHPSKSCDLQCEECDIPVCSLCSASQHKEHSLLVLSEIYSSKKNVMAKDKEELQKYISPSYKEIAKDIETQIANLDGEYERLTTALTEHGEQWHREIDNVINAMKKEINDCKIKHFDILKKHAAEIKQIQSLIEQTLINLEKVEESNDVSMTMEYSSKNKEFSKLPKKVHVLLPILNLKPVDRGLLYKLFGSLASISTTMEENGYTLKKPETPTREFELLKEPELITTINTGYKKLRSVTCLSEEEIWTCGEVSDTKCFSFQDSLIKTIKTKSWKLPLDIAVTGDGDLLYSDMTTGTVNKVKNGQTEEVIRLQGWIPFNLCVTSSGDLLVTMHSNDETQSKVVRYSGSTEKQTIQFDDDGKPLYSGSSFIKYITGNRNLDICVADSGAIAVIVVDKTGKLRFRYTGHPSATKKQPFNPFGITTDSQSQILTADFSNHCIHILTQHGEFLRYIDNCDLKNPYGVCVTKNNLFVAEWGGKLKKIKYLE